jgi:hypothetical protein
MFGEFYQTIKSRSNFISSVILLMAPNLLLSCATNRALFSWSGGRKSPKFNCANLKNDEMKPSCRILANRVNRFEVYCQYSYCSIGPSSKMIFLWAFTKNSLLGFIYFVRKLRTSPILFRNSKVMGFF